MTRRTRPRQGIPSISEAMGPIHLESKSPSTSMRFRVESHASNPSRTTFALSERVRADATNASRRIAPVSPHHGYSAGSCLAVPDAPIHRAQFRILCAAEDSGAGELRVFSRVLDALRGA